MYSIGDAGCLTPLRERASADGSHAYRCQTSPADTVGRTGPGGTRRLLPRRGRSRAGAGGQRRWQVPRACASLPTSGATHSGRAGHASCDQFGVHARPSLVPLYGYHLESRAPSETPWRHCSWVQAEGEARLRDDGLLRRSRAGQLRRHGLVPSRRQASRSVILWHVAGFNARNVLLYMPISRSK